MPGSNFDITLLFITVFLFGIFVVLLAGGAVFVLSYIKGKGREEQSVDSVLIQVAVPKGNEVKIDAMEQLYSALYSIKKGGWQQKYKQQPTVSFEIVARQEDIRFYIVLPEKLRDLVEKQIHGGYPGAEIRVVEEPNIFTPDGKV